MGFIGQAWTLTVKNLLIVLARHASSTTMRAFVIPVVYMFFISYAKNFFVPPSDYGIGSPTPVRDFLQTLNTVHQGQIVAFVDNGFHAGDIEDVIGQLSTTIRRSQKTPRVVSSENELLVVCHSSLRGVSPCYGAVSFHSSPTEGPGGYWNYTLFADGSLGEKVFVHQTNNSPELYMLPLQRAVDQAITTNNGTSLPPVVEEYPYTQYTNIQMAHRVTDLYQGTVLNILAVAFTIGIIGVTYQLVGNMASERELGMSQLLEAMMPNRRRWEPQAARLLANHLAFDIIYLPGWITMGVIVWYLVFPNTSIAILIVTHILIGLSLSSVSLFAGAFFKRAQLSGITATIVLLILAIIAQIGIGKNGSTGAVAILSLLCPTMNYTFFIMYMAHFQQVRTGTDLVKTAPNSPWQLPGVVFWIFMIVQILLYPILAALVETALHGTASKDRKMRISSDTSDNSIAVRLTNFTKHFTQTQFMLKLLSCGRKRSPDPVVAVNDLTLSVLRGQIMVLLGANGSGKSTTLEAIAGLNTITKGSIELDGTGGLGLCPQRNVLWDELTVYEHVWLFNRLKSIDKQASREENETLVAACDLEVKMRAKSSTLSGGQKRKLQLAMMFTGGSRVCCVDEVSSGIDPLARRKIWDILLAERGTRTILLTTHFLDEADVLSDHIAILSKGVLKAEGSAVELKHRLGGGYRIHVDNSVNFNPGASLEKLPRFVDYDQTTYQFADQGDALGFISKLETAGAQGHYRVQGPTVEDCFLKLADEIKDDLAAQDSSRATSKHSDDDVLEEQTSAERLRLKERSLNLTKGTGTGLFAQARILFGKRLTVLRSNYLPYCAAFLIPVVAAGLVALFLQGLNPLGCNPRNHVSISSNTQLLTITSVDVVYGPPDRVPIQLLKKFYPQLNATSLHPVHTREEFNDYIQHNYQNVTPGGFFISPSGNNSLFAYHAGSFDVGSPVLMQNLINNILSGTRIFTGYQPFAIPWAPSTGNTLQLILYFGLAMCAYPGFFALYPTAERLRKVRALHYSNGVRSGPLWSAYVFFDFWLVLVASVLAIGLFVAQWGGWYGPGYLFIVFFLYGLTSIVYSYTVSLFVTSQLAAFAFAAGSQCLLFLCYFITYLCLITYSATGQINHNVTIAHFTVALITPAGNLLRGLLLTLNEFSLLCRNQSVVTYPGSMRVYGGPILYLIVQFFLLFAFVVWWDSGGRISLFKSSAHRSRDIEESTSRDAEVVQELSRVASSSNGLRVLHLTKSFGSTLAVDDVTFGIKRSEVFALLGPNGAGKSTTISLIRGDVRPSSKESDVFVENTSISKHRVAARNHLGVCPQFDAMDQMTVVAHLAFYARIRGVADVKRNTDEVMRAVGLTPYAQRMAAKLSGGNKRKLSLAIALMGNPSVLLLDEPSSGMDAAAKRVMWRVLGSVTAGRALLITTHSMEEADALAGRAGIMAGRMLALGTTQRLRARHGDAYHVHLVHNAAPHTPLAEMQRLKAWVRQRVPGAVLEERGAEREYHGGQLRFSVANAPTSTSTEAATEAGYRAAPPEPIDEKNAGDTDLEIESSSSTIQKPGIGALFSLLEAHKQELGIAYYSVAPTTLDQVFLNVVKRHNVAEENYATTHGAGAVRKRRLGRRCCR